ncbi:MAG TPA: M23 family metallopeptidase [Kineosporiaceae bacterium]|nr:M23 family metallopeptidase [Kineosporiaceae bacterium]
MTWHAPDVFVVAVSISYPNMDRFMYATSRAGNFRMPPIVPATAAGLVLGALALGAWRTADLWSWVADACDVLALGVVGVGVVPWQALSPAVRWPAVGLLLAAAASAVRLPTLRPTGSPASAAVWALVLVVVVVLVARARRRRPGPAVRRPLRFPLDGTWYVVQGGGALLNHHARVPEQRAAVDLVRVGPWGTRSRGGGRTDPAAFLAWDAEVRAPCDGQVVAAVDGLEDRAAGEPGGRSAAGNHVVIDSGDELVLLAHLRAGSVAVATGEAVRAGRLLGRVGTSGRSTEPHLHLQADRDGQGLELVFEDVPGRLVRGRRVRAAGRP